jgi:tRNA(His) 5'-end guanylyltransferase
VVRTAKRQDPQIVRNSGQTFTQARSVIDLAAPNDTYFFDDIMARCPGDPIARKINPMTWRIK